MRYKIVGIFVCMLLIATAIPAIGTIDQLIQDEYKIMNHNNHSDYVPGEFIIKLSEHSDLSNPTIQALNAKYQVKSTEKVFTRAQGPSLDNIYLQNVPNDSDIISIVEDYASCPDVVYAEPNAIGYPAIIPNDYFFEDYQWALNNSGQFGGKLDADLDAPEAWDNETGNSDVIIAIIDTGIKYTHSDLLDKIWINEDEIPDNGIDDDSNGFIDDIRGWDFYYADNDPMDEQGHGTRCAGIPGMVTNNSIGGAGVC